MGVVSVASMTAMLSTLTAPLAAVGAAPDALAKLVDRRLLPPRKLILHPSRRLHL